MFNPGQRVNGVRCGRFVVVKVDLPADGGCSFPVVTVHELGPEGQLSSDTMRLPSFVLVSA